MGAHDAVIAIAHEFRAIEHNRAKDRMLLHSRLWHVLSSPEPPMDMLRVVLGLLAASMWIWLLLFIPVVSGSCHICRRSPAYEMGITWYVVIPISYAGLRRQM